MMQKISSYLKTSNNFKFELEKYLDPYFQKIDTLKKEIDRLYFKVDHYKKYTENALNEVLVLLKDIEVSNEKFIIQTSGTTKMPVALLFIKSSDVDTNKIENQIMKIGKFLKVEFKSRPSAKGEGNGLMVIIHFLPIESVIKEFENTTLLDLLNDTDAHLR